MILDLQVTCLDSEICEFTSSGTFSGDESSIQNLLWKSFRTRKLELLKSIREDNIKMSFGGVGDEMGG